MRSKINKRYEVLVGWVGAGLLTFMVHELRRVLRSATGENIQMDHCTETAAQNEIVPKYAKIEKLEKSTEQLVKN